MKKNYLRLVNEDNKINDTERPTHLVQAPFAQTGVFIDPIVAIQLEKLVKATGLDGQIITIDGYRSKSTQQKLLKKKDWILRTNMWPNLDAASMNSDWL